VDCIPALLGNTYSFGKALPKIFQPGLIREMGNSGLGSGHIGQKLQQEAERLGLKPGEVAKLFGVKAPSVYDWYQHGRVHKKHYPVLVAKFGRPLEWWLDFASPVTPMVAPTVASGAPELSAGALELARLFDLLPATDTVKRAQAQMACAQAIIALLQPGLAGPARTPPGKKTQSK